MIDINRNLEFYIYEDELWCKDSDNNNELIDSNNVAFLEKLLSQIKECYPDAYNALSERYAKSAPNKRYYRYMMAKRFIKCNFAPLDSTYPDLSCGMKMNFERADCPIRDECKYNGIICSPLFKTSLSRQEMSVAEYLYKGLSRDEIAGVMFISPETVKNHIRSIYYKLGVHERAEFVKYASDNKIFR